MFSACSYLLKYNKTPSCLNSYAQIPDLVIGETSAEMRRCFNELDIKCRGFLNLDECCLALKLLFALQSEFPTQFYRLLRSHILQKGDEDEEEFRISLDDFSALSVELAEFLISTTASSPEELAENETSLIQQQQDKRAAGYYSWLSSGFLTSSLPRSRNRKDRTLNQHIIFQSPFTMPCTALKKDVFLGR